MSDRTCTMPTCAKPHRARGLCSTHYNQQSDTRRQHIDTTCGHCGASITKRASSRYPIRFCSQICRELWRIETGNNPRPSAEATRLSHIARRETRCTIPATHPARWIGDTCPVPWTTCTDCGQHIIRRGPQIRCSDCAQTRRYARRSSRWTRRRRLIFERDAWTCWLCGQPVDRDAAVPHPRSATIDHVLPINHGGGDEPDNLACAHFRCNVTRGDSLTDLNGCMASASR
jgi:HNH endonuclease